MNKLPEEIKSQNRQKPETSKTQAKTITNPREIRVHNACQKARKPEVRHARGHS